MFKFQLKQKVWMMHRDAAKEAVITARQYSDSLMCSTVVYNFAGDAPERDERHIFATKEELLKSL